MNRVPVIVGGATKNARLSVIVGSVEKQGHDAYVIIGGVAKRFYQRAITWTYPPSYTTQTGVGWTIGPSSGVTSGTEYFTFSFSEPIYVSSVEVNVTHDANTGHGCDTPQNCFINEFKLYVEWSTQGVTQWDFNFVADIIVHSRDYGDFYLGNSGTTG